MKRAEYLSRVHAFIDWLALRISGEQPVNFPGIANHAGYLHISSAATAYCWPDRSTSISLPTGTVTLKANSSFAENSAVLDMIAHGLSSFLTIKDDDNFARWAIALMVWGGVRNGNEKWIITNTPGLCHTVSGVLSLVSAEDDDKAHFPRNLRSNAGFTKLYSVLAPDFIIYDSRVAAALAWLVQAWSNSEAVPVPELLRFRCMTAKNGKTKRNPDPAVFPKMNNRHKNHLHWNLRANWILAEALTRSRKLNPHGGFSSLRELEAGLFMMGQQLP